MTHTRLFALALTLALARPSAAADVNPLAEAIQGKAPALLAHFQKKGCGSVGVLKFLVRKGDGPPGEAGDLNLSLANKTEVALILANTDERFGIVDKASDFVEREKMTSANHLTVEGRKAFFTRKYDLAWSKEKVEPGAFLTGVATINPEAKTLAVRFQAFDKSGAIEDVPGGEVVAPLDPETLAQAGFSFTISTTRRKALVAGEPPPAAATLRGEAVDGALQAAAAGDVSAPFAPLADCPVKWAVLYNGKPAPVKGSAVPEPQADDRVEFRLSNPGPGAYAVVLLVNGENTLYQERSAPIACRKWVLEPGAEVTVRGFQTDADTVAPFRVTRPDEPEPDVVRYGPEAGTYRLVVYHGKASTGGPPADLVLRDDANTLAIARTRGGTRPAGVKPQSLRALQAELRGRAKAADGARGFVVKGATADRSETEHVTFTPTSDIPVSDVTLRYLTPRK